MNQFVIKKNCSILLSFELIRKDVDLATQQQKEKNH